MKIFNRKRFCAALAGLGILGMASVVQAVSLSPDGMGQVLIYPYYTVRANADGNAYDSLFTVINAKNAGKAVRVRIREGKAGHEVLEFNLYLAPRDVWTAAISANADGAQIATTDTSCTSPSVRAQSPVSFRGYEFSGADADGEDASLDRTREGYIEIIEMAEVTGVTLNAITHAMIDGVWMPRNCGTIQEGYLANTQPFFAGDLRTPTGGLFGNMTLINVNTARAVGYDAVALSGFYKGGDAWGDFGGVRVADTLWFPAGIENPNLSMAYPATSTIFDDEAGVVESAWTGVGGAWNGADWVSEVDAIGGRRSVFKPGLDAVSSVLMRSSIINEFNVAEVYAGATDWVITMPTKNLYFDRGDRSLKFLKPRKLFQREFRLGGAVDDVQRAWIYDREERGYSLNCYDGPISLPPPDCDQRPHLPWAANVIQFPRYRDGVGIFHSINRNRWEISTGPYDAGWAQIDIGAVYPLTSGGHTLTADAPVGRKFTGLPVVGFASTLFNNGGVDGGALGKVWASYVGTVPHRYERNIQ
ncbi:MAG: hypothetical protein LBE75_08105 [Burkholderiales bacterium]|jgi:hypothetical protein|nr:hypothetical protein [Burkholderiales bacterium]